MKFPHYSQLDIMDCGPTCLRIIAQHYGRSYSLQNLRQRCHISREGVSLLGISDAAESIGFHTTGAMITWDQLCYQVDLPCIIYWNQQHFVVVYKIKKERGLWWVYVSDPAAGLLKYSEEQFKKSWIQNHEKLSAEEIQTQLNNPNLDYSFQNNNVLSEGIALLLDPTPKFYEEKGDEDKRWNIR